MQSRPNAPRCSTARRSTASACEDDCEWMFADAATGLLGFNALARLNPLRWSGSSFFQQAIVDILDAVKEGDRPIIVKVPSGTGSRENRFDTAEAAIHFIESKNLERQRDLEANIPEMDFHGSIKLAVDYFAENPTDIRAVRVWVESKGKWYRNTKSDTRTFLPCKGEYEPPLKEEAELDLDFGGSVTAAIDHFESHPEDQRAVRVWSESQQQYYRNTREEPTMFLPVIEEDDLFGDIDCEWMFGDAATGVLGINAMARLNPLRWSGAMGLHEAVADIRDYTKQGNRPIVVKVPSGVTSHEHRFEDSQEAIDFIESQLPPAKAPLPRSSTHAMQTQEDAADTALSDGIEQVAESTAGANDQDALSPEEPPSTAQDTSSTAQVAKLTSLDSKDTAAANVAIATSQTPPIIPIAVPSTPAPKTVVRTPSPKAAKSPKAVVKTPEAGANLARFELFMRERNATEALMIVSSLLKKVDTTANEAPYACIRKIVKHWRLDQQFWPLFDKKVKAATQATKALRVVIVGAGPVGLRLAIELRLAGHDVIVIDKRPDFTRINRLHLWEWCKLDFISLGARLFDPPGRSFGTNADYVHIGIGEAQSLLFKFGLLLGIQYRFGVSYKGAQYKDGWCVELQNLDESASAELVPFDVLAGADGPSSTVAQAPELSAQFGRVEAGMKEGSAIGLVVNLMGDPKLDDPKKEVRQFSYARQFKAEMFAEIHKTASIALENCVYYRSGKQHYLVMTPLPKSLEENGVFVDPKAENLTGTANVNKGVLREMAMKVAQYYGLLGLDFAKEPNDVSIFDFSGISYARSPCAFFQNPSGATEENGGAMAVLVGDALMQPFWPEGLGILRGFHGVLDATAAINTWSGEHVEKARKLHTESCYNYLKTINCSTADKVFKQEMVKYTVDPRSRYK